MTLDLVACLAAIRRFKSFSCEDIAKVLEVSSPQVNRFDLKYSPLTVENAQAYADAIGARVIVRVEFDGFSQEIPLFVEPNS